MFCQREKGWCVLTCHIAVTLRLFVAFGVLFCHLPGSRLAQNDVQLCRFRFVQLASSNSEDARKLVKMPRKFHENHQVCARSLTVPRALPAELWPDVTDYTTGITACARARQWTKALDLLEVSYTLWF